MLVTDRARCRGRDLVSVVGMAVRGGVRFVLLRERDLDDTVFGRLAQRVAGALPVGTVLSIHSRAEVARALGAGLHLAEAAPVVPTKAIWHGRSVHDPIAMGRAREEGAAYALAGTVHASPGKPEAAAVGVAGLRAMCAAAGALPVYAIGGLTPRHVGEALAAGAYGVAVVGAILEADDPEAAARALCRAVH